MWIATHFYDLPFEPVDTGTLLGLLLMSNIIGSWMKGILRCVPSPYTPVLTPWNLSNIIAASPASTEINVILKRVLIKWRVNCDIPILIIVSTNDETDKVISKITFYVSTFINSSQVYFDSVYIFRSSLIANTGLVKYPIPKMTKLTIIKALTHSTNSDRAKTAQHYPFVSRHCYLGSGVLISLLWYFSIHFSH